MFQRGIPGTKGLGHCSGTMKIGWNADHGRVPVFFVVDPSETFSRDPELSKLLLTYGSGVSEGSTTKKTGQGKSEKAWLDTTPYQRVSYLSVWLKNSSDLSKASLALSGAKSARSSQLNPCPASA
jgi:hypothetical protein